MTALAQLLLLSPPSDVGTSPYVEEGHAHDWTVLGSDERGTMWWDRNYASTQVIDDRTFPVMLMRTYLQDQFSPATNSDILTAIDCESNQVAAVNLYAVEVATGNVFRKAELDTKFVPLPGPDLYETMEMMRAACGEDWTL